MAFAIREAAATDDAAAIEVLRRSDLSTRQPAAIAFYRSRSNSRLLVGELDGEIVGVGQGVLFGSVGWVGNIAVDPDHRRRGYGTAMTEAAVAWLQDHAARTVLLTATADGSRTYERIGFEDDGGVVYGAWARTDPHDSIERKDDEKARSRLAVVRPGALADAVALDTAATGEDRSAYLEPFADRVRVAEDGAGYRIGLPWGGGPVVAEAPDAGMALLRDLLEDDPSPRLGFPDANAAAAEFLTERGFVRVGEDLRMRLGPPLEFRPERIFCVFSFACG